MKDVVAYSYNSGRLRQEDQQFKHFSPKPGGCEHRAEFPLENLDLEKTNEADSPQTVHEGTMPPN